MINLILLYYLKPINGSRCLQDKMQMSWNLADKALNDPDPACLSNLISHYSLPPVLCSNRHEFPMSQALFLQCTHLIPTSPKQAHASTLHPHPPHSSTNPDLPSWGEVTLPVTHSLSCGSLQGLQMPIDSSVTLPTTHLLGSTESEPLGQGPQRPCMHSLASEELLYPL